MATPITIKVHRLLLAFVLTFLVVDTYPHPSLSSGLIETLTHRTYVSLRHHHQP